MPTAHSGAIAWVARLYYFTGIAFSLANLPVLVFVIANRRVPVLLGIDLDGGGPFERAGPDAMVVLLALFILFSATEVLAARWLQQRRRRGLVLAAGLLPVGAVFWTGFALPLPWILGVLKAVLLARGWRELGSDRDSARA